jgi:PAS domain S-box-containing protein
MGSSSVNVSELPYCAQELPDKGHFVQFYESDEFLLNSICNFMHDGLTRGEPCIVVATESRRNRLQALLQDRGVDIVAVIKNKQFASLDASETLATFMRDGAPDRKKFEQSIGGLIRKVAAGRRVRIYGEMVSVLCDQGAYEAATELEILWNALQDPHSFCLFCAYPLRQFGDPAQTSHFRDVCEEHTEVIPAESYFVLDGSDVRLREIAALQQKAILLQAEITEREKLEEQLRQKEKELTDFIENANMPLHWVGADGTILWANHTELEMLGYAPDEYIGQHISRFHVDDTVIENILDRLTQGETLHECPARLRCKDGSLREVLINSSVFWEDGKFVHTRCITRDVTELNRAAQALRESEEQLRAFFNSAVVGVAVLTPEARFVQANPAFCSIVGYSLDELCAIDCVTLTHPDDCAQMQTLIHQLVAGEIPSFVLEKRYFRKDGELIWVQNSVSLTRDPAGNPKHVVALCQNVTQRKRAEEELWQRERWLAGQKEAFQSAMRGEPLETCLAPLVRTAVDQFHGEARAAFYIAAGGATLYHAVGMPEDYGRCVDGFRVGPESLACGLATHTGEPVITSDVLQEPLWEPWRWLAQQYDYRGCWLFPVRTSGGPVLGTFALYFREPREASPKDQELAAVLTHAATIIISQYGEATERARTQTQLEAELADTKLLQTISAELIREENVETLFEKIIDAASKIMHSDFASMQILNPERGRRDEWQMLASHGLDPEDIQLWQSMHADSKCNCGVALKTRRRTVIPDLEQCAVMTGNDHLTSYRQAGIRAMQSTPLISRGGQLLGTISTHWRAPHEPSERDLQLLDILARQAADLIEGKHAQETMAQDLDDTALLRELGAQLTLETDIQVVYERVLNAARKLMRAEAATVQILDERTEELVLTAADGFPELMRQHFSRVSARSSTSCGLALMTGNRSFVDFDDPDTPDPDGSLKMHLDAGYRSAQSTPLISRTGRAIGMFSTHWRDRHRPSEREMRFLDLLARQAADLIEHRKSEAALRESEERYQKLFLQEQRLRTEAEEASRLKDEFLATASHELRTPLNAIIGWLHLLRSNKLNEQERARALATLDRNARNQAQLIEDILDVSRTITGKMTLETVDLDLASVIAASVESVKVAAEAKNITLEVSIETAVPHVRADANRFQQVIWNLLTNSVKFTPPGGRIEVHLKRILQNVQISVKDTGEGVPREFLPFVFDRFRQADGSSTRRHGGLGLGLAIVRNLVELHGGSVTAESEGEGRGATFTVTLPAARQMSFRKTKQRKKRATKLRSRNARNSVRLDDTNIILVDDDFDTLQILTAVLSSAGANVTKAASTSEAIEIFGRSTPDVLISDLAMPDEDGYSLIARIRKIESDNNDKPTPALALTAYARIEDRTRALTAGFNHFVPKPVEPDELIRAIRNLLANTAGEDLRAEVKGRRGVMFSPRIAGNLSNSSCS